jgi:FtsH-binding integral membrane protein
MNMNFNNSDATVGNAFSWSVSNSAPTERAAFIRKTYAHLAVAILAFIGLETLLINSPLARPLLELMFGMSWLIVLAAFMGISWLANSWASSDTSKAVQYLGLGLYIVAETIIFLPLLYIANDRFPGAIQSAAVVTLGLFAALTAIVFMTRKDFTFLGPILTIAGFVALGVIVCSLLFGFNLGIVFSAVMVLFAAGAILYDTSNVLHNYRPNQYVAASLSLFASVGLLFWYILQIFMSGRK